VAQAMGINVERYFAIAWAMTGVVSALGGIIWGSMLGVDIQLAMSNELASLKGQRAELFSLISFVLWAVVRNAQVDRKGLENDLLQLSQATGLNGQEFVSAALRSLAKTGLDDGLSSGA